MHHDFLSKLWADLQVHIRSEPPLSLQLCLPSEKQRSAQRVSLKAASTQNPDRSVHVEISQTPSAPVSVSGTRWLDSL